MRNIILAYILLLSNMVVKAEDDNINSVRVPRHDISVNCGTPGLCTWSHGCTFYLQYLYRVSKTLNIGVSLTYQSYNFDDAFKKQRVGNSFFILPTLRCFWFHKRSFSLYSRCALGARFTHMFANEKVRSPYPVKDKMEVACHICPIGMILGKDLYFKMEVLGIGFQGLADIGIGYQF